MSATLFFQICISYNELIKQYIYFLPVDINVCDKSELYFTIRHFAARESVAGAKNFALASAVAAQHRGFWRRAASAAKSTTADAASGAALPVAPLGPPAVLNAVHVC